jgi:hypothetical protein
MCQCQVVARLDCIRIDFESLTKGADSLIELAAFRVECSSVIVGGEITRILAYCFPKLSHGLVGEPPGRQGNAEVMIALRTVGLQADHLTIGGDSFLKTALAGIECPEMRIGLGVIWS